MRSVQALQAKKLNLLHDVLSCIGEQGTEALVRYINENSVENHHHYNGRSLPYSKVFIAWKSAEFLNESWQAPIDQFLVTHDSLQTSTLSQIPAMLSCCHKYARKPENRHTTEASSSNRGFLSLQLQRHSHHLQTFLWTSRSLGSHSQLMMHALAEPICIN